MIFEPFEIFYSKWVDSKIPMFYGYDLGFKILHFNGRNFLSVYYYQEREYKCLTINFLFMEFNIL